MKRMMLHLYTSRGVKNYHKLPIKLSNKSFYAKVLNEALCSIKFINLVFWHFAYLFFLALS